MDINGRSPRTVVELAAWLRSLPEGTSLPARGIADYLERFAAETPGPMPPSLGAQPLPWAALVWVVPAETRIGVRELTEATGRPKSWVYRHTSGRGDCPRLPHRKLDGELVFVVGEVRPWLVEHEVVEVLGGAAWPRPLPVRPAGQPGQANRPAPADITAKHPETSTNNGIWTRTTDP